MSADIALDKLGDRMSAEDRETFTATMDLVTHWLVAERDRFALLHDGYWLDNLLFDPAHTRVSDTPGRAWLRPRNLLAITVSACHRRC